MVTVMPVAQWRKKKEKLPLIDIKCVRKANTKSKIILISKFPPIAHTSVFYFAKAHCESATCLSSKGFGEVKIMLLCILCWLYTKRNYPEFLGSFDDVLFLIIKDIFAQDRLSFCQWRC